MENEPLINDKPGRKRSVQTPSVEIEDSRVDVIAGHDMKNVSFPLCNETGVLSTL